MASGASPHGSHHIAPFVMDLVGGCTFAAMTLLKIEKPEIALR